MIIAALAVLGLIFGSFLNAMVSRMHAGKDWVRGRSQCDGCGHQLAAKDLVPLLSWLSLKGRCRYCGQKISWQHPAIELATAAAFILSYIFWPASLGLAGQKLLLVTWLISVIGLMALLVYDARWMTLPNRILYPTFFVAAAGRLAYILGFADNKAHSLLFWVFGVLVASGLFWLLFMVSGGRWIGYGDVRLGLVTGTLLASPWLSFLMIFIASVLGTLAALPDLIAGRKGFGSKLPFGPFLITATAIAVLFGDQIVNWYKSIFLP
ncbi:MAG TPA: prepilin peptidase [Candidatus Saccharimonadales bacterium]|nr:prepilin peptidase [Candidatus Saccharimonadales bacterium]